MTNTMPPATRARLSAFCEHCGVALADVLRRDRHAWLSEVRHMCIWLVSEWHCRDASQSDIARWFNRGNHTTVFNARGRAEKIRRESPQFRQMLDELSRDRPRESDNGHIMVLCDHIGGVVRVMRKGAGVTITTQSGGVHLNEQTMYHICQAWQK